MKIIVTVFALFCALGAEAQGNTNLCFRYPIRVVGGTKVDLSYLFSHWHTGANAVTNGAWLRLTGTVLGNSGGWIVDGETDSAADIKIHQHVLLLNPPIEEKLTFDNASAQLDAINAKASKLREAAGSYDGQVGGAYVSVRTREASSGGGTDGTPMLVVGKKSNELQQKIDTNAKRTAELNNVIQGIPHTNAPSGRIYKVDFFVLSTGKVMNGLPVLDFGTPSR